MLGHATSEYVYNSGVVMQCSLARVDDTRRELCITYPCL